jgi:hypothetical protein
MSQITEYITTLLFVVKATIISYFVRKWLKSLEKDKYVPSSTWTCNGITVVPGYPHLEESMTALTVAPKFANWLTKVLAKKQMNIHKITITDINWFAAKPTPEKLGFVKYTLDATDIKTDKKIMSNIVFCRGNSVAVLIIVKVLYPQTYDHIKDKQYVLLCEQMRAPVGERIKEICAGMTDAEGNIASVALKEVQEETGFIISHVDELIPLQKIMPSPGACDEEIDLYAWITAIPLREFEEKKKRIYGNKSENEEIKLSFMELNDYINGGAELTGDVKGECAIGRYMKL